MAGEGASRFVRRVLRFARTLPAKRSDEDGRATNAQLERRIRRLRELHKMASYTIPGMRRYQIRLPSRLVRTVQSLITYVGGVIYKTHDFSAAFEEQPWFRLWCVILQGFGLKNKHKRCLNELEDCEQWLQTAFLTIVIKGIKGSAYAPSDWANYDLEDRLFAVFQQVSLEWPDPLPEHRRSRDSMRAAHPHVNLKKIYEAADRIVEDTSTAAPGSTGDGENWAQANGPNAFQTHEANVFDAHDENIVPTDVENADRVDGDNFFRRGDRNSVQTGGYNAVQAEDWHDNSAAPARNQTKPSRSRRRRSHRDQSKTHRSAHVHESGSMSDHLEHWVEDTPGPREWQRQQQELHQWGEPYQERYGYLGYSQQPEQHPTQGYYHPDPGQYHYQQVPQWHTMAGYGPGFGHETQTSPELGEIEGDGPAVNEDANFGEYGSAAHPSYTYAAVPTMPAPPPEPTGQSVWAATSDYHVSDPGHAYGPASDSVLSDPPRPAVNIHQPIETTDSTVSSIPSSEKSSPDRQVCDAPEPQAVLHDSAAVPRNRPAVAPSVPRLAIPSAPGPKGHDPGEESGPDSFYSQSSRNSKLAQMSPTEWWMSRSSRTSSDSGMESLNQQPNYPRLQQAPALHSYGSGQGESSTMAADKSRPPNSWETGNWDNRLGGGNKH